MWAYRGNRLLFCWETRRDYRTPARIQAAIVPMLEQSLIRRNASVLKTGRDIVHAASVLRIGRVGAMARFDPSRSGNWTPGTAAACLSRPWPYVRLLKR